MFNEKSRYYQINEASYTDSSGNEIIYKKRRILPQPERFSTLTDYKVEKGQRLDQVSSSTLGDPSFYWKLGDANAAFSLTDLEQPGEILRIPVEGSDHS